jgi:hypothetical protein
MIIKRVSKYLHGTTKYAICYQGKPENDKEVNVYGIVDIDWDEYIDKIRLTSGYVFRMFGGEIS